MNSIFIVEILINCHKLWLELSIHICFYIVEGPGSQLKKSHNSRSFRACEVLATQLGILEIPKIKGMDWKLNIWISYSFLQRQLLIDKRLIKSYSHSKFWVFQKNLDHVFSSLQIFGNDCSYEAFTQRDQIFDEN